MIDAEDRALLETSLAQALADAAPGDDVDALLEELDWQALLEAETADAIDLVFRALGRVDVRSSALDDVLLHALGEPLRDDVAVVLPAFGAWSPPGERGTDGGGAIRGLVSGRSVRAKALAVVSGSPERPELSTSPTARFELEPIGGVDPEFGLRSVQLEPCDFASATPLDPDRWSQAVALAQRAVASWIAGLSRTMLEMARSHALEREQFGAPIAQFQTLRHRLSEALVAVESTEACLVAARDEPNAQTAAMAKALSSRNARTVARHAQQILAGVGFTTEHAFHRFLKRTMLLEGLFGSADAILLDAGRVLLETRHAPTLIEL